MEKKVNNEVPKYSVVNYILFFFIFSFIGWIWEVGLHLVQDGQFVNRGVMFGPWLPIYGSGGVFILLLLKKFYNKPVTTFMLAMVICSVIEYFTSWYLEVTKGLRWWDYSGYLLNINGRICLLGAVIFGLGGCAINYVIAPRLKVLLDKESLKFRIILCITLTFLFIVDLIYSKFNPNTGDGVTDYKQWEEKEKA